jgi:hypothetical protein
MINFILGYKSWKDILVFNFSSETHLLQGAKHRLTKKTKFRIAKTSNLFSHTVSSLTKEALKEADLWE